MFAFVAKHRGIWPVAFDLRGARCLAQRVLWLVDTTTERSGTAWRWKDITSPTTAEDLHMWRDP